MVEHLERIPPQKLNYAPVAVGAFRAAGRGLLARALRAARAHDGSARALERLVDDIDPLDAWAMEQGAASSLSRDEVEQGLLGHLRNTNGRHRPLTISEILDMAAKQFGKRLAENRIVFDAVETGFCFIPPDKEERITSGNGSGVAPPSFVARFDAMVRLLNAQEIATDDLIIYRGALQEGIMRQRPYQLIQIPRLDREILVCDQVGEASFVGKGLQGPIFWATYGKKMLGQQADVTRIVHAQGWEDGLLTALFKDNASRPRNNVKREQARWQGFPLTVNLILVKALEYAAAHEWQLPTQRSGPIEGLPGQIWGRWNDALHKGYRGLKQGEYGGLGGLFSDYGLKQAQSGNKPAIEAAYRCVAAGEPHGLSNGKGDESLLSIDKILVHALSHAAVHEWQLPTQHSGAIEGLPGQTWLAWNAALSKGLRGLKQGDHRGVVDLFREYGLKQSNSQNRPAIEAAYRRVAAGEAHGLSNGKGGESLLSIGKILVHALEYAAAHEWQLPTDTSGPIEGLPGQTWQAWEGALNRGSRGLKQGDHKGLGDLFRDHGLKNGRMNIGEAIRQAWERYNTTGEHGLVPLDRGAATPARPECAAVVAPVASCG